jgi:hypothetical protein
MNMTSHTEPPVETAQTLAPVTISQGFDTALKRDDQLHI